MLSDVVLVNGHFGIVIIETVLLSSLKNRSTFAIFRAASLRNSENFCLFCGDSYEVDGTSTKQFRPSKIKNHFSKSKLDLHRHRAISISPGSGAWFTDLRPHNPNLSLVLPWLWIPVSWTRGPRRPHHVLDPSSWEAVSSLGLGSAIHRTPTPRLGPCDPNMGSRCLGQVLATRTNELYEFRIPKKNMGAISFLFFGTIDSGLESSYNMWQKNAISKVNRSINRHGTMAKKCGPFLCSIFFSLLFLSV